MAYREAYEPLLEKLYDGVTAPDGFQLFIEALVSTFAVRSAVLAVFHDDTHAVKELWQHGVPRGAMERYALEFAQEDMLAQHIVSSPIAHFYASNLDLPDQEGILKSRFFREWAIPQDLAYAAGSILLREGAWATQLFVQRSSTHAPFSRDEMNMLNRLVPHMQRAMQMRARFTELQLGQDFLAGGLDLLAMPAIFFDEHSRVAYMNKRAHALLEKSALLQVEHGHLVVKHLETARKLNYEIGNAIRASRGTADFNEVVLLPRDGLLPLMLMVAPVCVTGHARGAALLFVFDPDAVPSLTTARVRKLFGLTDAEARLAVSLSGGMTLDDIANERPVSLNTLKTQLKSIFAKTGTRRQAELISLLLASPAYFLADVASPLL
jgi:DNA-binding CsgD family transcriptional regulator/PAS domain-containing protein